MAREQRLEDGSAPALLDIVDVPLSGPKPSPGQPENYALGSGPWKLHGALAEDEALDLLTELATSAPLFGNRGRAVSQQDMPDLESSLAIVAPEDLAWTKRSDGKLRAVFTHAGRELDLPVSDPAWRSQFDGDPAGTYDWPPGATNFLTISITAHAFHGFHWKLVAGVVSLDE